MKPIGHLIASLAVLAITCGALKATAEPRHGYQHNGHGDCAELTFDHGRLRVDPDGCRDEDWRLHGNAWHERDDRHEDRHRGADAVLFEHSGFRGAALPLRRDVPDLAAYDFDDRASSIVVRHGRWEGCTETGYRGRCWRVSGDDGGFAGPANNAIRSIRRVR